MWAASPTLCSAGDLDFIICLPCSRSYPRRITRAKECDNDAKYCESLLQSKWCHSGAKSITPSLHQGNVTTQCRGSRAHHHLGIAGTAVTSLWGGKNDHIIRRGLYAWKSFLRISNRLTSCAVSICSHCKIVSESPGAVPTALLPPGQPVPLALPREPWPAASATEP